MPKLLTTQELKNFIQSNYEQLKKSVRCEGINCELDVYFGNGTTNNVEGTYTYSDETGYHYVYTEKGNINSHKITDNLFEISYWIYANQAFKISLIYAKNHRKNNQDFRRVLFAKEIELLGLIGENYRKRGEIEVDEILKVAPYNDNVL